MATVWHWPTYLAGIDVRNGRSLGRGEPSQLATAYQVDLLNVSKFTVCSDSEGCSHALEVAAYNDAFLCLCIAADSSSLKCSWILAKNRGSNRGSVYLLTRNAALLPQCRGEIALIPLTGNSVTYLRGGCRQNVLFNCFLQLIGREISPSQRSKALMSS